MIDKLKKKDTDLETENAELKAQIRAISSLTPLFNSGVSVDSEEIDLRDLWNAIWKGKWLIIAITSTFAIASVLYSLSIPNQYESTVILAPAEQSDGGLGKLANRFSGIASIAGINISGGGSIDKSIIALEIVKSWEFIDKFIEDNKIHAEVFAAKGWSKVNDKLLIDNQLYDEENKLWIRKVSDSSGKTPHPSSWELYEKFKEKISVEKDEGSGLISLSVEHYSPKLAKEWTDKLVKAINFYIQEQDRIAANKNILYLNNKINETNIADMKAVFYQLIEEQIKTLMLAELSDEYVFKTIVAARVAEEKSKPKRAIICIIGVFIGGLLAIVSVILKNIVFKR